MSGFPSGRRFTGPAGGPPRPRAACCAWSAAIGTSVNNTTKKRIAASNGLSLVLKSNRITLVLPDLKILFRVAVQRHSDREGLGKSLRILDRRFVGEDIRTRARETFDHMKVAAMKVAG